VTVYFRASNVRGLVRWKIIYISIIVAYFRNIKAEIFMSLNRQIENLFQGYKPKTNIHIFLHTNTSLTATGTSNTGRTIICVWSLETYHSGQSQQKEKYFV